MKTPPLALAAVEEAIDAWSGEWFCDARARAVGTFMRVAEARRELRSHSWQIHDDGVAIALDRATLPTLGAHVMSLALDATQGTTADIELLERVGTECLDALKKRLCALFALDQDANWSQSESRRDAEAVYRLAIGNHEMYLMALELSEGLFARFVKARLAPPPVNPLGMPAEALGRLPVNLSAMIGTCGISIAELSHLTPGDVLRLDRRLDQPVPLAIGREPLARGACTVVQKDDALALKLTQSPAG